MDYKDKYLKYKTKYTKLKFKIQNGGIQSIPKIGLGTWQAHPDNTKIKENIIKALEIGYRCFDCANNYNNEIGIGEAFQYAFEHMGISREDLYIIGKANRSDDIENSLANLKIEYFDLALIHLKFMVPDNRWEDFIKLKNDGKTKNIGLSNIYINKLKEFNSWCVSNNYEKPLFIEDEINVLNPEQELVDYCNDNCIGIIAYTPLVQISTTIELFNDNQTLNKIKNKYNITLPQLFLLWAIRRNITVIPGSSSDTHMYENFKVLEYIDNLDIITTEEVSEISGCVGSNYPSIETAQDAKLHDYK